MSKSYSAEINISGFPVQKQAYTEIALNLILSTPPPLAPNYSTFVIIKPLIYNPINMARGVNKVILVGNLGKDPEVQTFDTYKKAAFSLATTEHSRDREGNELQHTEWHNIVMWRGLAEIAEQFLHKGSQVYIEGKIRTRSFDGKDGQKKYITEIQADNLVLLGGRKEGNGENFTQSQSSAPASTPHPAQPVVPPITEPLAQQNDHDDLPF